MKKKTKVIITISSFVYVLFLSISILFLVIKLPNPKYYDYYDENIFYTRITRAPDENGFVHYLSDRLSLRCLFYDKNNVTIEKTMEVCPFFTQNDEYGKILYCFVPKRFVKVEYSLVDENGSTWVKTYVTKIRPYRCYDIDFTKERVDWDYHLSTSKWIDIKMEPSDFIERIIKNYSQSLDNVFYGWNSFPNVLHSFYNNITIKNELNHKYVLFDQKEITAFEAWNSIKANFEKRYDNEKN